MSLASPTLPEGFFTTVPPGKLYSWFIQKCKLVLVCRNLYAGQEATVRTGHGLKLNIQKTKIMASGPITSWKIDGDTMETVTDFILGGSQITADGDCSHEIKRHLLLGRKVMTNLDSILKNRDNANKGPSSQSHGFSNSHIWM